MKHKNLGPNGGLIFAMEFIIKNCHWFDEQLMIQFKNLGDDQICPFTIIDLPGQVQLYTNHTCVKQLLHEKVIKQWSFSLCVVNLLESRFCLDLRDYLSGCFVTLNSMMHLELPFLSLLSKIDILVSQGGGFGQPIASNSIEDFLHFNQLSLSSQCSGQKLKGGGFEKLIKVVSNVMENYNLISFSPLNIFQKKYMAHIVALIDKTICYHSTQDDDLINVQEYLEIEQELIDQIDSKLVIQ